MMSGPAIPAQFNNILIDPNAWLTILEDPDGTPTNEVIRPIDRLNETGEQCFGLGAPYPFVRAIVTGYHLTDGGGTDVLFYDDPASVIGVTYRTTAGYLIVAPLEAIVRDLGDEPFPLGSGPSDDDGVDPRAAAR